MINLEDTSLPRYSRSLDKRKSTSLLHEVKRDFGDGGGDDIILNVNNVTGDFCLAPQSKEEIKETKTTQNPIPEVSVKLRRASTITDPTQTQKKRLKKNFYDCLAEELEITNNCQIVRLYTRLCQTNLENNVDRHKHLSIALFLPGDITTRSLLALVSEKLNKIVDSKAFTLRWIRFGGVEERVFANEEQPLNSKATDFFSTDDCRFYLCEHACQINRRPVRIDCSVNTEKPVSVQVEISCVLFVRHIMQVALSKLNMGSVDVDDFQLNMKLNDGTLHIIGMWDCPGCLDTGVLYLTKKDIPISAVPQRRKSLVSRVSRISKSFRQKFNQEKNNKKEEPFQKKISRRISTNSMTPNDDRGDEWTRREWEEYAGGSMRPQKQSEPIEVVPFYSLNKCEGVPQKRPSIYNIIRSSFRGGTSDCGDVTAESSTGIFGALIADASHNATHVPYPLKVCLTYIEKFGLDLQGIYRVNGGQAKMNLIRESFNRGEPPDLSNITAHNLAGVVKSFYRDFADPLMPNTQSLEELKDLAETDAEKLLTELTKVMSELPPGNLLLLKTLMRHLYRVKCKAEYNSMTSDNLAIVFRPTVKVPMNALVMMIEKYKTIFKCDQDDDLVDDSTYVELDSLMKAK